MTLHQVLVMTVTPGDGVWFLTFATVSALPMSVAALSTITLLHGNDVTIYPANALT